MKRYETPQALRRALEDRLLAQVRKAGGDIQRLRRQTAFDRLLCRLFHEANPPWLLKGGYAMELRIRAARTTRDIDLAIRQLPGGAKQWEERFGELASECGLAGTMLEQYHRLEGFYAQTQK